MKIINPECWEDPPSKVFKLNQDATRLLLFGFINWVKGEI